MNKSWLYSKAGQGSLPGQEETRTKSVGVSMVSAPLLDSPDLVFDKPPSSRHRAVFKSLPVLGHDNDPLDEELQQLSDSLGILYEQESSEMDFLESFMDYDDISLIYSKAITAEENNKGDEDFEEDEDQIVVVTDKNAEITHEILINGDEEVQIGTGCSKSRSDRAKVNFAERIKWLRSRLRVMFRNMRCNCRLPSGIKRRLNKRRSKRREEYKVKVEKREEGAENIDDEEEKSLIKVKSFDLNQKRAAEIRNVRSASGYDKAVSDLENLEKLILRDSVRETVHRRRRGMETISEERDLAFSNLSYDQVQFSRGREPQHNYENVEVEGVGQHLYENVEQKEEQFYENIPARQEDSRDEPSEEYESYDFGENGIYQNIVFSKAHVSNPNSDVNVKVDALQKCINEVNEIIKTKTSENLLEEAQQKIQKPSRSDHKLIENDAAPRSSVQNKNKNISSTFRSWALGSTEHPKIELNKLTKTSKTRQSEEMFSQEEKNVVSDFLKSIRNELKM